MPYSLDRFRQFSPNIHLDNPTNDLSLPVKFHQYAPLQSQKSSAIAFLGDSVRVTLFGVAAYGRKPPEGLALHVWLIVMNTGFISCHYLVTKKIRAQIMAKKVPPCRPTLLALLLMT
jgi:hypothetical protein